jgi:sugar lactone lactonase YvrE
MQGLARATLDYRLTGRIGGRGFEPRQFQQALRGLALDAERVVAVGDSALKVFALDGALVASWKTSRPGECVAVDGRGRIWVGESQQVEVFDAHGRLVTTWQDPGRLGVVTAIGFGGGDVFLADASARWVRRYDGEGHFRNNVGDRHRKGGFDIPNGALDFAVGPDGVLHVANPGMHRVERYQPDGTLLGHFGRFDGRDPAGFPGCCNPTNLTLDGEGRVIVTEKAGPRLKIYDRAGGFVGVVAADFDANARNMDVAVDARGRIYVADTARLAISVFAPGGKEAA